MSERKVLNKYYPIDFDNYKLPKLNTPRNKQYVVRLMAPFTMRCLTCGEYIYHGRKFNARKETAENESYLGIPIHRFYIRCTRCMSEITFKTDPQNTDYVAEHGAVRTFQAHKVLGQQEEDKKREKEEDEANNPMLALENRTRHSRREMDVLDALEDIKDQNARFEQVDLNVLLKRYADEEQKQLELQEQQDEELVKSLFEKDAPSCVKRLQDDDSDQPELPPMPPVDRKRPPADILVKGEASTENSQPRPSKKGKASKAALLGVVKKASLVKPAEKVKSCTAKAEEPPISCKGTPTGREDSEDNVREENNVREEKSSKADAPSSGLALLGSYSDSDSDHST